MTVTLAASVNELVTGAAGQVAWMLNSLKVVDRFLWLVDHASDAHRADAPPSGVAARVPDRLVDGITLHDVGFRYPETEEWVLRNVELDVPAGSTVALVGDNGAGKSTLVKLLARFYPPTEGTVLVDGVDLRDIPAEDWRARLSAGFQDFARLELIAAETVGIGDVPRVDDRVAVSGALERAGGTDVVTALPEGLETLVGSSFDGGQELSGGQWQKLALGRAMMREGPLLLLLDEPTASLDADTEHALFVRWTSAAQAVGRATGAVTVLVSHRFSTVRMADLIAVVDGGRIAEVGSHDELVARGGLYAELYELQARAYR
jgi:ATP-binding cassette subfamily B protein